jgi:hypothetical protein
LLGASAPKTELGTIAGRLNAADTATVLLIKSRLLMFFFRMFCPSYKKLLLFNFNLKRNARVCFRRPLPESDSSRFPGAIVQ